MKPGGIICIVHKSAVWPKWQDQQDKLVASKAWEKVWINEEPVSNRFCLLRNETRLKINLQNDTDNIFHQNFLS